MPVRHCKNKIGPGEVSLINRPTNGINQLSIKIVTKPATNKPNNRLVIVA
ncbi:MAG: hypothetical protein JWP57_570 [Spirosoma sp.]|nr:hypothetical protein [Spirosoma sp.]